MRPDKPDFFLIMSTQTLQVTLNGEPTSIQSRTIAELLEEYALQVPRVAVVRNGDVVPRGEFADCAIAQEDVIDIITIIGGG